ncbi:MAG: DUF2834 domain-containing protein [Longimicrobiaceae bacterium]
MGGDTRGTRMEYLYFALAVVGYIAPGVPMVMESIQTGNIGFWTQPGRTFSELFVNRTSTAFALDLFGTVVVALIWMTHEAKRVGMRSVWVYWLLTWTLGLAGTLPLFLALRERALRRVPAS